MALNFLKGEITMGKLQTKLCEWCREDVPYEPSRIISERGGHAVLRDKTGRLHSLRPNKMESENYEQQIESSATQAGTAGREIVEANREEEQAFIRFSEVAFGE
jgi:hypothetical protein